MRVLAGLALIALAAAGGDRVRAWQPGDPGPTFRVFLTTGQALPIYGEAAILDDRVVFMLMVGDGSFRTRYQVMSLPVASVDVARTQQYSHAVRAIRYAATRGETDYTAMTAEVSRALDELVAVPDAKQRLSMAEEARRRLLAWSRDTYGYRADDVRELAALFDEVIAELRAAAGESRFTIDLVAGPPPAPAAPIQRLPTAAEAVDLAFAAAARSDVTTDRRAVLRAIAEMTADLAPDDALRREVEARLDAERQWDRAYAALEADVLARADAAVARGDVGAIDVLRGEAAERDRLFGSRRPEETRRLEREIDARLTRARARADQLAFYRTRRPVLLDYERRARFVFTTLDGASPSLTAIRETTGPGISWLDKVEANLKRIEPRLQALPAPAELSDVHSTLRSALGMALDACRRRRTVLATGDAALAREASAAAAGAMLLADHARRELLARLYPPRVP